MEIIGNEKLWSFTASRECRERGCFSVRRTKACKVTSFLDLATKIAHLQFKNPNYVLLFRGQNKDHQRTNKEGVSFSSLCPSLFRRGSTQHLNESQLQQRFAHLKNAERLLVERYEAKDFPELERLKRQQVLRWSILQHYEICPTPLLDVTQSLRIAASFASEAAEAEALVYALGVPNLSGAVTASAEAGIQIVRLASVCPPSALRPHIQEGFLLGEYPEMAAYDQKQHYAHFEIDFGRRLVAKFRFNPAKFWRDDDPFPPVSREALYPNADDPLYKLAQSVKGSLGNS